MQGGRGGIFHAGHNAPGAKFYDFEITHRTDKTYYPEATPSAMIIPTNEV